jgi:hypothetical protein
LPNAWSGLELIGQYADAIGQYLHKGSPSAPRVLGLVSLWGKVVECEQGYRASHAYPLRIYVPDDALGPRWAGPDQIAEQLASAYGVETDVLDVSMREAAWALVRREIA